MTMVKVVDVLDCSYHSWVWRLMADEIYSRIGAVIRARREALGLSQGDLGTRVGVGRTSITMIERGGQGLMVHQLVRIASALRTTPSTLLNEAGHEPQFDLEEPKVITHELHDLLLELARPVRRITRS